MKKSSQSKKAGQIHVEGGLRTSAEKDEAKKNAACFDRNPESWGKKIENFPKYVRRQNITRFLALYEIFKRVLPVKGSIVECGVFRGFGLMSWSKFSAILEPVNLTRRIYGFDSFAGFPEISKADMSAKSNHVKHGDLHADSYEELKELIAIHDSTRFLGHVPKTNLIRGNATKTIPAFVKENPHLVVSLLFMDFDLYEPTKIALEHFVPRMPKGAVIAFDELDNPLWPGETLAMLEHFKKSPLKLERVEFDPYISFAVLD
ncbi:TylF/MycF family methyltransferase [bacterium]|nr:TylF/MycF family methyltransferase [bacterium]